MRGRISLALCAIGIASFASSAAIAAITVLGGGLGKTCYDSAEYGGDPRAGIKSCTDALDQTALSLRDRAATLINRGILHSRIDETQLAIEDYDQGLSVDPTLAEGYIDRGAAMIVMHRYTAALEDIDKGISLNANRLQIAYYDRGIVDEALGNVKAAYEDYKKAAEIAPDFALANAQLARFKVVHHHDDGT